VISSAGDSKYLNGAGLQRRLKVTEDIVLLEHNLCSSVERQCLLKILRN
jgi:hypothetical protein